MIGICPICEKETEIELNSKNETIEVRGELIEIKTEYFQCLFCGEDFEDPNSDHDTLDEAYREYRCRHEMVQPEEIKESRERYGLTQHEFARLLGCGLATLSHYENGALQDEAHNDILRLIRLGD